MSLTVSVPGKLLIAGEYAILEPGAKAIVMAVDRFINLSVSRGKNSGIVTSKQLTNPLVWEEAAVRRETYGKDFILNCLKTLAMFGALQSKPINNLNIEIISDLDHVSGKKYGLGSSAALVVALTKVFNLDSNWGLTKEELFKLALLTKWQSQPRAAGADVAASVYGGVLFYCSPDRETILRMAERNGLLEVIRAKWPGFQVQRLQLPKEVNFTVAWTGSPAVTEKLIKQKKLTPAEEVVFVNRSNQTVEKIRSSCLNNDSSSFLNGIAEAQKNLIDFIGKNDSQYETQELASISKVAKSHGAVSKISGAGGGDCALVFSSKGQNLKTMLDEWKVLGITHLPVQVSNGGTNGK